MTARDSRIKIGAYRPIYLWGGPGTIRMNRLKFMDQPVDIAAHDEAHSEIGARRVTEALYSNWVHLTYDWGFPPETEAADWEDFGKAAATYHRLGEKVFAYIQTSNCVFDGSFRTKDWYALDPQGRKIFYYSGRYMVCLMNREWRAHLKDMIHGALERGADGIFFDNLWHGAMPGSLMGAWLGAAGCHCSRCRQAYREASGNEIPTQIKPDDPQTRAYLRYRADQVTDLVSELAEFARKKRPGVLISANDYDIFMRASYLVYGLDFPALARIQDIAMIENFALPAWSPGEHPRLANNALTVRNALPAAGETHLSVLSYDLLIGLDPPYTPRRYQQGIAEAAALGASMTIKGTEYFYQGAHTLLTPVQFAPVHRALKTYNRWLESHADLYQARRNAACVGLLFPGEELWLDWHRLAPIYHGAGMALLQHGIPWKVVYGIEDTAGLQHLLTFNGNLEGFPPERQIDVTGLPAWTPAAKTIISRNNALRRLTQGVNHGFMDAYFRSRTARRWMDAAGMPRLYSQSPLFYLPDKARARSLLGALPASLTPRVVSSQPVLIDVWDKDGRQQVHLMNYAASPQTVKVIFDRNVTGRAVSPDFPGERLYTGQTLEIQVNIYTILLIAS